MPVKTNIAAARKERVMAAETPSEKAYLTMLGDAAAGEDTPEQQVPAVTVKPTGDVLHVATTVNGHRRPAAKATKQVTMMMAPELALLLDKYAAATNTTGTTRGLRAEVITEACISWLESQGVKVE